MDYLPLISAIANLIVAVGALMVFIGIFVLVVRLGRAVEILSEQNGREQPRRNDPPS